MEKTSNKTTKHFYPKRIDRKAKPSIFSSKLRENLMTYLFNFLSYKDLYQIGKTSIIFNNALALKQKGWLNAMQPLAEKYSFSFTPDDIRDSIDDTLKEHAVFPVNSDQRGLYVQLYEDYIRFYSLAYYFDWAWKGTTSYWRVVKIPNAALNEQTPVLIDVCYLNKNFSFHHIKEGYYKLYLIHFVTSLSRGTLDLKVKVGNIVVYTRGFPTKEMIDNCKRFNQELKKGKKEEKSKEDNDDCDDGDSDEDYYFRDPEGLYNQYLCEFVVKDLDELQKNEGVTVSVEFFHNDLDWKNGWYIHGGYLDKTY